MMIKKKCTELRDNSIIKRNPKQVYSAVDDEIIMLSIENGEYYNLDSIGKEIWDFLESPHNLEEIIIHLIKIYDVSADQCLTDTIPYLKELLKYCILQFDE